MTGHKTMRRGGGRWHLESFADEQLSFIKTKNTFGSFDEACTFGNYTFGQILDIQFGKIYS